MHKYHAQQAIAQMPQVSLPDPFGTAANSQISEDSINGIVHPARHGTSNHTGFPERNKQVNPELAQDELGDGQPILSASQEQSIGACRQHPDNLALMHIGRSQVNLGNQSWPIQANVKAKAVENLAADMIFAKAGHFVKAIAAIDLCKLADGNEETIDNAYGRVMKQQTTTDQAPQMFFYSPQIGGLAHKCASIHLRHRRKKCI